MTVRVLRSPAALALSAAVGLAAAGLPESASAQDDWERQAGFYGGARGGLVFLDLQANGEDLDTNTGLAASLITGYQTYGPLRFEIEGTYFQAGVDESTLNGASVNGGDVEAFSVLVNGYYDIDTGTPLKPHVGVGAGGTRLGIESNSFEDDEIAFAWNAIAGVNYNFDGQMTFSAQYKYLGMGDVTWGGSTIESKGHVLQAGARVPF